MQDKIFSESQLENIVYGFLFACGIGLVVAFLTEPFIQFTDSVFIFFDKNSLIFVADKFEPFRVGLEAGFLGSFFTFLAFIGLTYRHKANKS